MVLSEGVVPNARVGLRNLYAQHINRWHVNHENFLIKFEKRKAHLLMYSTFYPLVHFLKTSFLQRQPKQLYVRCLNSDAKQKKSFSCA